MEADIRVAQNRRRNVFILKQIRIGHENQMHRLNDSELHAIMQDSGLHVSLFQVRTMLQDLKLPRPDLNMQGYVEFKEEFSEEEGCVVISEIILTASGLRCLQRRKNNDDLLFN
jgi:hypothetical protein